MNGEPLLPAPLVVRGQLVTFDETLGVIADGALYVDRDGVIAAVGRAGDPVPAGFSGDSVNVVDVGDAVVYPGLIDLHNHIAYNCLPLWIAPGRDEPWTARYEWPKDPDYLPSITLPVNALCRVAGKAVLKYVETKAVVGGVTAIQGSSKVGRPFEGWMVRNVEYETFRTGRVGVRQAVFALEGEEEFARTRASLAAGDAFVYHLAEGTDPALVSEYSALEAGEVLAPRFVGIHCTALGDPEYSTWAPRGGSVVWSPFSNLWLYGATTDVAAARARGMRICLGADWSPSGSKSLLGELKVADLVNRELLGGLFSNVEICSMATCNPADALGWEGRVGRLSAGLHADLVVVARRSDDVHRNLVTAVEDDVLLVTINGYPMYGVGELMAAGAAVNPEPVEVGGGVGPRVITLRDERVEDADMSWPAVLEALEAVRRDPGAAAARRPSVAALGSGGGGGHLELIPDMPWDGPSQARVAAMDLGAARIPPLDSLVHDGAYFDAVDRAPLHGGVLSGLRAYYER